MFGIDDAVTAVTTVIGKVIDRAWPDPTEAAKAKLAMLQMAQTGELAQLTADTDLMKGQLAVNQAEAASANIFVAGWRPFIGWVCGSAFALHFVVMPTANYVTVLLGKHEVVLAFDMSTLMTLMLSLLGLGAQRTFEKVKGVAK